MDSSTLISRRQSPGTGLLQTTPDAAEPVELSREEIERYSRHLILPEVSMAGQKKLKAAKVLLIGAGGLGAPLSLYLAAAGVGKLGIVDNDTVDLTNLQRQILYRTDQVGEPKARAAAERLHSLNPEILVEIYETRLSSENALDIIRNYDLVVDGTDNFPTRYLINDACVLLGKPQVYGSIFRFEGQVSVFWADQGPCYRCLYPEPPPPGLVPSCAEGGVLGILPGVIGSLQATEAIKLILGIGKPLIGQLVLFDALSMDWKKLETSKRADCPVCGENPTVRELIDYEQFCGIRGEQPAEAPATAKSRKIPEITVEVLEDKIDRRDPIVILDVRQPHEVDICRIPESILIPLDQLDDRMGELDPRDEIIVYCRSGIRSARATKTLRKHGYLKASNLEGGILAWADRIDTSMPKY